MKPSYTRHEKRQRPYKSPKQESSYTSRHKANLDYATALKNHEPK
ncbi:hypothetical protein M7I_0388 [Glarea lozoyensis 74030]|uniref:Uncharacterized protein n=1 Tax=Glarea lozoyensis (strain ATCC 74030 / MF5533) TaxID=1104152 RepID=H0ED85_GLAL7|nr:hypothetical protein M7I_0388 [Glarea lozoyensis 74030]